mgnify:CR=1 FL=1
MFTLATVLSALELGFIYALVALALFLSFRVLNIADMTTDGAFTLGCAVSATAAVAGHPFLGLPLALLAGAAAGFVTAFLQTRLAVPSILAGIITNTGLYTVNLAVMGFSSNVPMLKTTTIFTVAQSILGENAPYKLLVAALVTVVVCVLLILFLGTRMGLSIRATGDNPDMVRASSINTAFTITVGLCISNAMTALSGAVLAQYQRSADINLGTGMVVIGLASLIIGETLFGRSGMWVKAVAAVIGSVIYRFIIALALRANVPSECLKLISAVIVALAIAAPAPSGPRRLSAAAVPTPRKKVPAMLELKNIGKTFNPGTVNEKIALEGVNLHLDDGDFATIVGSNGAGKSTLFNAIAGEFIADTGTITLAGKDITFLPDYKRSKAIGRMFQDPLRGTAPHMTIEENLALAFLRASGHTSPFSRITKKDRDLFAEKLSELGLGLEDRMKQPVGLLSGGQRQALTLLMATLVTPKLLLLDEHTAALDPATADKVLKLTKKIVAENHLTCLMITHNMHDALTLGNRTLMMDHGHIVLDIGGEERAHTTVDGLLDRFAENVGHALDNDRILLSKEA